MTGNDALNAFYLALDEAPGDAVTLLALSDWFEERGNVAAAACVRWSARRKRWPFRYHRGALAVAGADSREGWYWWARDDPYYGSDWGHPQECRLPSRLWALLRHSQSADPLVFKEYETVRLAYEALIAAWPRAHPLEPLTRQGGSA